MLAALAILQPLVALHFSFVKILARGGLPHREETPNQAGHPVLPLVNRSPQGSEVVQTAALVQRTPPGVTHALLLPPGCCRRVRR